MSRFAKKIKRWLFTTVDESNVGCTFDRYERDDSIALIANLRQFGKKCDWCVNASCRQFDNIPNAQVIDLEM